MIGIVVGIVLVVTFGLLLLALPAFFFLGSSSAPGEPGAAGFANGIVDGPWVADITTSSSEGDDTSASFIGTIGNEGNEVFTVTRISSPWCDAIVVDGQSGLMKLTPASQNELVLTCDELTDVLLPGDAVPIRFEFKPFGELESRVVVSP